MLEAYSLNQTVAANGVLPFNSVTLKKGCTAELSGVSSIQLNKCGIYEIIFNITATASAAGNIVVNMTKNGTVQPQATRTITGATTTTTEDVSIATLVQVTENNNGCCCSSPTTVQFINAGVGVIANNINVVVTKIC